MAENQIRGIGAPNELTAEEYTAKFNPVVEYLTVNAPDEEEPEAAEALLLRSPNNTLFKVVVNDEGELDTVTVFL